VGQVAFPYQANGSVMEVDGKSVGSELLAQWSSADGRMWGRVMDVDTTSFTDEEGAPALYAAPSNLSPTSDRYSELVAERVARLREADVEQGDAAIPVDLVTCSGSGIDPGISPAAAEYQVPRIVCATGLPTEKVEGIVSDCTSGRFLGVFGEPTVNVLKVNLALDEALGE
jgi:K+-transporting ATPase ATPase C chain